MTYERITELQKAYNITGMQDSINSGLCWHMEGSYGRSAMNCIEAGICMLPPVPRKDAYGSTIPPRTVLKPGTKGTLENSERFWQQVEDGDFEVIDSLENFFGAEIEEEVK